jgi:hypothetical protein
VLFAEKSGEHKEAHTALPTFKTLWRLLKIFLVIQIVNAVMDYYVWAAYGFLVPSWVLATLSLFYVVLIFAVKTAQEKEANPKDKKEEGNLFGS